MYKVFQIIDCDANMKEEGLHFSLSFSFFCVPVCEFQDLFWKHFQFLVIFNLPVFRNTRRKEREKKKGMFKLQKTHQKKMNAQFNSKMQYHLMSDKRLDFHLLC